MGERARGARARRSLRADAHSGVVAAVVVRARAPLDTRPPRCPPLPDRETLIGKQINDYLANGTDLDDHVIHLLFSANRWEKK